MNRNWRLYCGVALAVALAVSVPAGAQQKQPTQNQKQAQTKPSAQKPAPFDPCTGSGLPPSSQAAPFTPDAPGQANSPKPKSYGAKVTCSHGKCKVEGNDQNSQNAQQQAQGSSLPLSPGATKAGKKNTSKERNAFPLAKSEAAQKKAAKANAPQPSAADANPFPEAESRAAQEQRQKAEDASPQQGVYSSSNQRLPGVNALGNGPAETQGGFNQHPAYDPALGKKDDKVGHFYLQTGDWAGAYGRYKQAAEVNPKDIKAVIGLAIAADHLGKRKVAIQNYKLYLMVMPDGKHSKEALKALKRLTKKK